MDCEQFLNKIHLQLSYDFKSLEELGIWRSGVKEVFKLDSPEHELSLTNLKTLNLGNLNELEALYKGPARILRLQIFQL